MALDYPRKRPIRPQGAVRPERACLRLSWDQPPVCLLLGQEVSRDRLSYGRAIEIGLLAFIAGGPNDLVHNVPWIAGAQLLFQVAADEIDQIVEDAGFELDLSQ